MSLSLSLIGPHLNANNMCMYCVQPFCGTLYDDDAVHSALIFSHLGNKYD